MFELFITRDGNIAITEPNGITKHNVSIVYGGEFKGTVAMTLGDVGLALQELTKIGPGTYVGTASGPTGGRTA